MSILATDAAAPAADVAQADLVRRLDSEALRLMIANFTQCFAAIWLCTTATPQEVFNQFGTSAGSLLTALQARLTFITALAVANGDTLATYFPDSATYTAPYSYTVNVNGTVTLT